MRVFVYVVLPIVIALTLVIIFNACSKYVHQKRRTELVEKIVGDLDGDGVISPYEAAMMLKHTKHKHSKRGKEAVEKWKVVPSLQFIGHHTCTQKANQSCPRPPLTRGLAPELEPPRVMLRHATR